MVWSSSSHKALTILNPDIMLRPGLMLMSGHEITIPCDATGIFPLNRVVHPVGRKINPWLWTRRAK